MGPIPGRRGDGPILLGSTPRRLPPTGGGRAVSFDHGYAGEGEAMTQPEERFEFNGINHLALVCRDMGRTVDFYTNVLGMPLVKTIELPAGMGQHFFFDCGGGDSLAFFWFPDAPEPARGVSAPAPGPTRAA